jgi:hypothetical protein
MDWIGCVIFFHDQYDFFKPSEGAFIIPWDFKKDEIVRYFGETTQLAIADTTESPAGLEGGSSNTLQADSRTSESELMDPTKLQELQKALEYVTRPERDQFFDDLVSRTLKQAAPFRKSAAEKQSLEAHRNALARESVT